MNVQTPLFVLENDNGGLLVQTVFSANQPDSAKQPDGVATSIVVDGVEYFAWEYRVSLKGRSSPKIYSYIVINGDHWQYINLHDGFLMRFIKTTDVLDEDDDVLALQHMFVMEDLEDAQVIFLFTPPGKYLIDKLDSDSPTLTPGDRLVGGETMDLDKVPYCLILGLNMHRVQNVTVRFSPGEPLNDPCLDAFVRFLQHPTEETRSEFQRNMALSDRSELSIATSNLLTRVNEYIKQQMGIVVTSQITSKALQEDPYKEDLIKSGILQGMLVLDYLCDQLARGNICAVAELERFGTDDEMEYSQQQKEIEPPADPLGQTLRLIRIALFETMSEFRRAYIKRTALCFDIRDYCECLLDTHLFGNAYTPFLSPRPTLVWRYRKTGDKYILETDSVSNNRDSEDRFVLADGSELSLVPPRSEDAYSGILRRANWSTYTEYKRYRSLTLSNVLRLEFFNVRLLAKASLYTHPASFFTEYVAKDRAGNISTLEACQYALYIFNTNFWETSTRATFQDTSYIEVIDKGIFYRFVNDTLYAYKFVTVSEVRTQQTHAMVLMLHCEAEQDPQTCVLNVNVNNDPNFGIGEVRSARAQPAMQQIHLDKAISDGICITYTFLCAEIYLMCAPKWQEMGCTGMVTCKLVLYRWLSRNRFGNPIGIDFFDPMPPVPMDLFAQRRLQYQLGPFGEYHNRRQDRPEYLQMSQAFMNMNDFQGISRMTITMPRKRSRDAVSVESPEVKRRRPGMREAVTQIALPPASRKSLLPKKSQRKTPAVLGNPIVLPGALLKSLLPKDFGMSARQTVARRMELEEDLPVNSKRREHVREIRPKHKPGKPTPIPPKFPVVLRL